MRVVISEAAADHVRANGGLLWIWASRPKMCCNGAPTLMHASTTRPARVAGFGPVDAPPEVSGVQLMFRAPGGSRPDVLEVGMRGLFRPRIEAYWDSCLTVM